MGWLQVGRQSLGIRKILMADSLGNVANFSFIYEFLRPVQTERFLSLARRTIHAGQSSEENTSVGGVKGSQREEIVRRD